MKFSDIFIDDTKNVKRINSDEYLTKGSISVIDQGKELIAGYASDDVENACYDTRIIFGDHTRVFKYIDFPFVCGADGTKVLKIIDSSKINYKYMYYYLLASNIPNTGYNRHFKWVKELSFKPVDINSQMMIVNKLDKINNLIDCRKKEIEKCDNLIKSQFVEMFKGCPQTKLYEIANITMGQSPNSESYNDSADGTPFFQGKADYGDKYTIVKHWTNQPSKLAYKGDVLMSVRAPVGPVNIASCDCCIGRGLCSITAKDGLTNNEFLFNALNTIQEEIASKGTGSTFKAITKNDVYNIELPLGSFELQNKFAQIVEQIDKQKFVNLKIFQLLGKKLKK